MLDLSHCKRISAKGWVLLNAMNCFYILGLLGLRSMSKLRFLRLEGLDKVEGIAKSALLLEDAIPELVITGIGCFIYDGIIVISLHQIMTRPFPNWRRSNNYSTMIGSFWTQKVLLFHSSFTQLLLFVRECLRWGRQWPPVLREGHCERKSGRLWRRQTVSDFNDSERNAKNGCRGIWAIGWIGERYGNFNNIFKLFPAGKLRHFLVGSPSGYSWTEQATKSFPSTIICPLQVETILTHEEGWRRWESIPTDLKMLPRYKRTVLLEAKRRQELLDADKILERIEEDARRSEEKQIGMLQAT